jgi:hypothetical protein
MRNINQFTGNSNTSRLFGFAGGKVIFCDTDIAIANIRTKSLPLPLPI